MEAKRGDRIAIDGTRVGQPPREGTIKQVTQGLAGTRYTVSWDDGHESSFSPSGGNLIVQTTSKSAAKARKTTRTPPKAKKTTGRKR